MCFRQAALAALLYVLCATARAQAPVEPPSASPQPAPAALTLDAALARVARAHPELRLFGARQDVLLAELDAAALRPPQRVELEVEDALGVGDARGVERASVTLGLAGVFERGGKLDARRILAQGRIDALAVQREAQRLDLLAEVARRWLAAQAARAEAAIAREDIAQRGRAVAAAGRRLQAGASPESVLLSAQAALARAEMTLERAMQQDDAARRALAALWGQREPAFALIDADLLALPAIAGMDALALLLDEVPELMQIVDERRIREARLQLARSSAAPDLDWRFGVRWLQEGRDAALVGGVSLPLGSRARAQPEIRVAEAQLASLELEREARDVALYATLAEAHGRYRVARLEVERTREDILPRLTRAERAAERAYRAGATSYLEWAQLQAETTEARRRQLGAALEAQRALIELQRLSGAPLLPDAAAPTQGTSP